MILSSSATQPFALLIFCLTGTAMGVLYAAGYFAMEFVVKKELLRHLHNVLFTLIYGTVFALIEIFVFEYNIHAYHFFIAIFFTLATAILLYLPMRKYRDKINGYCDKVKEKIKTSKHYKRFVK